MEQTTNTRDKHPCPQQDLNPRSQQSSGCRPMPKTTRPLRSASRVVRKINYYSQQLIIKTVELLLAVINAKFQTLFEDIHLFILYHSDDVLIIAKT
jgi:hypothetical protein